MKKDWKELEDSEEKRHLYMASSEWYALRNEMILKEKGRCERCGEEGRFVHHRTYARLYHEDLDDLELLCESCHETHHHYKQGSNKVKEQEEQQKEQEDALSIRVLIKLIPIFKSGIKRDDLIEFAAAHENIDLNNKVECGRLSSAVGSVTSFLKNMGFAKIKKYKWDTNGQMDRLQHLTNKQIISLYRAYHRINGLSKYRIHNESLQDAIKSLGLNVDVLVNGLPKLPNEPAATPVNTVSFVEETTKVTETKVAKSPRLAFSEPLILSIVYEKFQSGEIKGSELSAKMALKLAEFEL